MGTVSKRDAKPVLTHCEFADIALLAGRNMLESHFLGTASLLARR
jgi:hypothetical protein